jgi:hypothetical protein
MRSCIFKSHKQVSYTGMLGTACLLEVVFLGCPHEEFYPAVLGCRHPFADELVNSQLHRPDE